MKTATTTALATALDLAKHFRRFGLSRRWLIEEAEAGRIPSMRAGRRLLFNLQAVERCLLQRAAGEEPQLDAGPDAG